MGASQEELDWDESDLGGTPPPGGVCEMVKVEERPIREPRVRLVQHQYEEVELGEGPGVGPAGTKEQSYKESWVEEEEGTGLPKGWQRLRDDAQREYYWHTPTGRTQYTPPGTPGKVSFLTPGLSQARHTSPCGPMCTMWALALAPSNCVCSFCRLVSLSHPQMPLQQPKPSQHATLAGCPSQRTSWSLGSVCVPCTTASARWWPLKMWRARCVCSE